MTKITKETEPGSNEKEFSPTTESHPELTKNTKDSDNNYFELRALRVLRGEKVSFHSAKSLALAIEFIDKATIFDLLQQTVVEEIFRIGARRLRVIRDGEDRAICSSVV